MAGVPVGIEFGVTEAAIGKSAGGVGTVDVDFRLERLEVGLVPRSAALAFVTPEFAIGPKVGPRFANTALRLGL